MPATAAARLMPPAAWACFCGCLLSAAAAQPLPGEIALLVDQLGAPQFARREAASRSLVQAGRPAVDALAEVIRTGDLEVASRGVEVIGQMLASQDEELVAAAEACLAGIAAHGDSAASRLAAAALEFHMLGKATAARERLEFLGAVFRERPAVESRGLEVEVNAAWRGTPADFRQLARLRGLAGVSVFGVPVDDATLALLAELRDVTRIELFGTGAGREAAELLAKKLPAARIDVRKGGKLGVSSLPLGGTCEIRTVEPGSAADQAGLRSGDVVLTIDDEPVKSFEGLTERLADCAPGELVMLTIARRGGKADGEPERLKCEVRLDAW